MAKVRKKARKQSSKKDIVKKRRKQPAGGLVPLDKNKLKGLDNVRSVEDINREIAEKVCLVWFAGLYYHIRP